MTLVCPACRHLSLETGVSAHALVREEDLLICVGCGVRRPVIDEIGCVIDPVDAAALACTAPQWPPSAEAWCERLAACDPSSAAFREAGLLGAYAAATHDVHGISEFVTTQLDQKRARHDVVDRWLSTHAAGSGPLLEFGCGMAGLLPSYLARRSGRVVMLDARLAPLRLARELYARGILQIPWRQLGRSFSVITVRAPVLPDDRVSWVVANALDPPFQAGQFDVIVAMALLDDVRNPAILLGQINALLRPGGLLILGSPYHLESSVQNPMSWLDGPRSLRQALTGTRPGLEHLAFNVLDEEEVAWPVPAHDRLVHLYATHLLMAQKRHRSG